MRGTGRNIVASAPYFMIGPNWSAVRFSEEKSKWNSLQLSVPASFSKIHPGLRYRECAIQLRRAAMHYVRQHETPRTRSVRRPAPAPRFRALRRLTRQETESGIDCEQVSPKLRF